MMNRQEQEPVRYEDIWDTAPEDLSSGRGKRKLHIWQVLLFFVACMILFYYLGSLAQYYFGLGGVMLSQLGFLLLSIGFVRLLRADFHEVFPVQCPKLLGIVGVFVTWFGVFFSFFSISFFLIVVAPNTVLQISQSINNTLFGTGFGAVLVVLMVSIAPAICEETMHRGVILAGFRTDLRHRKWLIILCSGLIFGIFHLYPVRMVPTAFIGFVMAYLTVTTNNLFYSAFLHFIHNGLLMLIQVLTSGLAGNELIQQSAQMLSSMPGRFFGIYIAFFGAPAPILLYLGCYLVRRATAPVNPSFLPAGQERKNLALFIGSTLATVLTGIVVFLVC